MNPISDFIFVQTQAIKESFRSLKHLPMLALHIFIYAVVHTGIAMLLVFTGIARGFMGGVLLYLVRAMLFSHLLYTMEGIIETDRFYLKHIKEGFTRYLSPVINTFFLYYIFTMLLDAILGTGSYQPMVYLLLELLLYWACSAFGETIYIGKIFGYNSATSGLNFVFENPLNWGFVNILFFGLGYFLRLDLNLISSFPGQISIANPVGNLIYLVLISALLIYRGHLYKLLHRSSIRGREYQRRHGE